MDRGAATHCLDDIAMLRLIRGDVPWTREIEAHLDRCDACRRALAETVRHGAPSERTELDAAVLEPGAVVGRYVLLGRVGAGANGVVYSAHDPELDRRVAIKLVTADDGHDARRLAEARTMAQLPHPNIVPVHDAGRLGSVIYIVMEYLRGGTLGEWQATPRPWGDVVDRYLEAGAGLVAAHETSTLHRDFKPANVLLDDAGRARVADFGLASASLEAAGAVAGTPIYMSPEALAGAQIDERSDQYSFCAALFVALSGQPPFAGATLSALVAAKRADAVADVPLRGPRAVRTIVRRGLHSDPARRFEGMAALLSALRSARGRRSRRVRWVAAAAVLLASVGATWAAARPVPSSCVAERPSLLEARMQDRVRARAQEDGAAVATAVDRTLARADDYAERWAAEDLAICRGREVGALDSATATARTACLAQRRAALTRLFVELDSGDRDTLARSAEAVWALAPVDTCGAAEPLPNPDLSVQLEAAAVLRGLGKYEEAATATARVLADARAQSDPWTEAEALRAECSLHFDRGSRVEAKGACEQAAAAAMRSNHARVQADALIVLFGLVGGGAPDSQVAVAYGRLAEAAVERTGDLRFSASLAATRGDLASVAADGEAARAWYEAAVEFEREARGDDHPAVALRQVQLADALPRLDRTAEGLALAEDAQRRLAAAYGEASWRVAVTMQMRGTMHTILADRGVPRDSDRHRRAALELHEGSVAALASLFGQDSPRTLAARAQLLVFRGQQSGADAPAVLRAFDQVFEALRSADAVDERTLAQLRQARIRLLDAAGQTDVAAVECQALVNVQRKLHGRDNVAPALVQYVCGLLLEKLGRDEEALHVFEESYGVTRAALGLHHARTVYVILRLETVRARVSKPDLVLVAEALHAAEQMGLPDADLEPLKALAAP